MRKRKKKKTRNLNMKKVKRSLNLMIMKKTATKRVSKMKMRMTMMRTKMMIKLSIAMKTLTTLAVERALMRMEVSTKKQRRKKRSSSWKSFLNISCPFSCLSGTGKSRSTLIWQKSRASARRTRKSHSFCLVSRKWWSISR